MLFSKKSKNITFFKQLEHYICSALLFVILTTMPFFAHAKSAWTPTFDYCAPESEIIGTAMYAIDDEKSFDLINTSLSKKETSTWLYWALKAEKHEIAKKFLNFNADSNALVYCHAENKAKAKPMLETIPLIKVEMLQLLVERGLDVTPKIFEGLFYSQGIPSKNPSKMRVIQARKKIKNLHLLVKSKTPNYKKPGLGKLLNLPDTGINQKAVASFISWLIKEGIADGNRYTPGGTYTGWPNTALSYAIIKKREYITQALMKSDINIAGIDGSSTPLWYAIGKSSEKTVTSLLEKGIYTQEQLNLALSSCALRPELYFIQYLLIQAGAKPNPSFQCEALFCALSWPDNKVHTFLYRNNFINVYKRPTDNAEVETWDVTANQEVDVSISRVNSTKVVLRKAKENFSFECGEVQTGDFLETLQKAPSYSSNNTFFIRHKNKVCKSDLSFYPKTILVGDDTLDTQWWVRIQKSNPYKLGWIKVNHESLTFK